MNEPKLRFPEFSGEWEEKKLGEECEITAGGDIPKEKISKEKTEIYKVPIISNGIGNNAIYGYTDSPKITQAAITISARGTIGYAEYREYPYYPIVRLLSVFPKDSTSLNTKYLSYILSIQKYDVTNAGIPQLTVPMIGSVIFHIPPSPAEQDKIASCLSAMDDLIAAQAEKVEVLKEKKMGLMQQLFPQNGETTPRLRFPEFTGEWEVKKLGEVAKKVNRKNTLLKVSRVLTNSANLGVVDQGAYFDRDIAVKENTGNYSIVEIEDFIYNPRISTAAPVGPISINKVGQGIMSPLYTIFKFHTGSIPFYEQYFQTTIWHSYLKGIANFGARFDRMNITTEGFFNMPLYVPTDPAEQQKIASCLSALDDHIAAETEKLTALKDYKKGLMQQLFPQPAK